MAVSLGSMATIVITFVMITIVIAMASMIVTDIQDTETDTTSYLYNTSDSGLSSIDTVSDFLPSLGIIIVIVVIIGALMLLKGGKSF